MLRLNTDIVQTALDGCVEPRALHRFAPQRYPFFLQSTASHPERGRYDVLFIPTDEALVLDAVGTLDAQGGFLASLDSWWRREYRPAVDLTLPFTGGWFLYLGYELAAEIEPALNLGSDTLLPAAFAVRCPAAIIRDGHSGTCSLVRERDADIDEQQILEDLERCRAQAQQPGPGALPAPVVDEESPELFLEAVAHAKRYIAAGDIYQANLSRGWRASVDSRLDSHRIFEALERANPAPFAGLASWKGTTIISSSPERLLAVRGRSASTRPIAGTRPRSDVRSIDAGLSAELVTHPKERAEHVMLIDLERNDLGRVCVPGSVTVDEMMVIESYAHVHHIVSNVRGELRADVTPGEAIRAVFPGGTITGCPKVRCMEIIRQLEAGQRGAYTGSFGYLNRDGSCDLNILIRTMVHTGNTVTFRAGSGIVADSDPDAELAETRVKAKGLVKALSL